MHGKPMLTRCTAVVVMALLWLMTATQAFGTTTWQIGDVFAGVADGKYQVYSNTGVFKETISDSLGGLTTGCSFNSSLTRLYTTDHTASDVVVYNDPIPHGIAQTIPTGKTRAESIVFAANGHFFVGGPFDPEIEEYDASGTLVQNHTGLSADGTGGPDWIDLAADQKTIFYTSEGRIVKRFDVAADVQLADFATLPGSGAAYALRLLAPGDGSGGLLVADGSNVKRLNGSGVVAQTYDVAGEDSWFSLNLDPNGTSFWAGDYGTANFYRFNISSGALEIGPINTGTGFFTLFGICLKGEITAAIGNIVLTPPTAQNQAGTNHAVTATVTSAGNPVPGKLVSFSVSAGPNIGATGPCAPPTCITDSNGQVSWTYTSNGTAGTDTIQACFDDAGITKCATASKEWTSVVPTPATLDLTPKTATNPVGTEHCVTATVRDQFGNPMPNVPVDFVVTGANLHFPPTRVLTDASGQAKFCYVGTNLGDDTIDATVHNASASPPSDEVHKTWTTAQPATLVLTPPSKTNDVDTQHCVTATVKDQFGTPTPGITVRFTVTGSAATFGTRVTDANGEATFCYLGPGLPGADVITAFADTNNDGTRQPTEPQGTAAKTWVIPLNNEACKVTYGGRITAVNGDKATFGGNAQGNGPKGQEEYQDHGPAVDINVHSINVLAVTCSADGFNASIFGKATINGAGSYDYRIDLLDLAEPGRQDTYRIRLSNGYDSGNVGLAGGNVQIH